MELFFGIWDLGVAQIRVDILQGIEVVDEAIEFSSLLLSHNLEQIQELSAEKDYSGGHHARISKIGVYFVCWSHKVDISLEDGFSCNGLFDGFEVAYTRIVDVLFVEVEKLFKFRP